MGQSPPRRKTNGTGAWRSQPIEWWQRRRCFRPPWASGCGLPRRRGSPLFFAARRAWPSLAEPSRTQPSPAEPRVPAAAAAARAPPSQRASERSSGGGRGGGAAPGGGGARSPQTARGRGRPGRAAAGAAGGGCAAEGEGRGRGRCPCPPPAAPRPQAPEYQSAPSIPLPRTLPQARTGLCSGKRALLPRARGPGTRDPEMEIET